MRNLLLLFSLILSFHLAAQPIIDGAINDSDYSGVAVAENNNMGFGPDIDVNRIRYYSDPAARIVYIGVAGELNVASSDGIGLMINFFGGGSPAGAPACSPLGWAVDEFGNTPGHYMSGNFGNNPFFADFEVDYMFAINPGNSSSSAFLDFVSVIGGAPVAAYLGDCGQGGGAITQNDPFTGLIFTFAFDNSGAPTSGFEIAIDYSATTLTPKNMEAFAFVVSSTAFFSDVTVPGNVTTGNPGFGADFCALTGGLYHSTSVPVPVELITFEANADRDDAVLNWSTATEINSSYFSVEHSIDTETWNSVGEVAAAGESYQVQYYDFVHANANKGVNYYRLLMVDEDGSKAYSPVVSVMIEEGLTQPGGVVFPNPVQDVVFVNVDKPSILRVFDTAGRIVHLQQLGAGAHEIQLSNWNPGMYWVQAQSESGVTLIKEILIVE